MQIPDQDLQNLRRYRPIIDDWEAFQEALRRPLPTALWTNTLKAAPEQLAGWLDEQELPYEPVPWHPGAFRLPARFAPGTHWPYCAGWYYVQEEVAMLPARLLAPAPGERVLDLCAAPGGKTSQLAVAMQNQGTVVANDNNPGRLRVLRSTSDRLGLANVSITIQDAASYPDAAGLFDAVLADVPCSCEGTSRKHPGVLLDMADGPPEHLPPLQERILERAVKLCRPGGRIVYATCTYAPEENEAVVDATLRTFDGKLRLRPVEVPGLRAAPGLTEWDGRSFHSSLTHALRLWPHQQDTGGFFVAVLEKQAD